MIDDKPSNTKKRKIKASRFDKVFDKGDVTKHLDLRTAKAYRSIKRIQIGISQGHLDNE